MQDPSPHLATTLKALRKDKGLSLDATSKLTGVSKAMLGQIERGESSPTIQTLWKISNGLSVSFSTFLENQPETSSRTTVIRTAKDIRQNPGDTAMQVAPLFPYDPALKFEHLELTFDGGYERLSEAHAPGVIEFLSVIDGELEVLSDDQWHTIKAGQSIRFAGDQPHGYKNQTDKQAKTLIIIHYPNGQ